MNKITLKNFFKMLLAGILIVIMMLVQISSFEEEKIPLTFTLGLIVIIAAIIFMLYVTIQISNALYQNKTSLDKIKKEVETAKDKEKIEEVKAEEIK